MAVAASPTARTLAATPSGGEHAAPLIPAAARTDPSGAAENVIEDQPQPVTPDDRFTGSQVRPPSSLLSSSAVPQPCIAQLPRSNRLAQSSPLGPAARWIWISGVTGPPVTNWPVACQLCPPSVLVRNVIPELSTPSDPGAVSAAHSRPLVVAVANTGLASASTLVQVTPPSWLTRTCPGHRAAGRSARQLSAVAMPNRSVTNWTRLTLCAIAATTCQF